MKKIIILPALLFSFTFFSCSTDDTNMPSQEETNYNQKSITVRNVNNDKDFAGDLYTQMLDDYKKTYGAGTTLDAIVSNVNILVQNNTDFTGINDNYTGISSTDVTWVINNSGSATNILSGTVLPENVKLKITSLLSTLDAVCTSDYASVNTAIKNFETGVINDNTLTATERGKVLAVASIARYMNYEASGSGIDRSRWWQDRRTGLYGAVKGVEQNISTAIVLSSVITISEDK